MMSKHLDELRAIHGEPSERVSSKVLPYMTEQVMDFIKQSPFAVMATANDAGDCDASPRGGLPGFIRIINEKSLLIPDIKGNRLFQSYENIVENPKAGLLFFQPGNNRCARVNGRVRILQMEELQELIKQAEVFEADENTILIQALVMEIDEAYIHCPRALQFSALWKVEK